MLQESWMFGESTLTDPENANPARGGEGGIRHAPGRDNHYNGRSQSFDSKSAGVRLPPDLGGEVLRSPR
jgi:hypothetical protein